MRNTAGVVIKSKDYEDKTSKVLIKDYYREQLGCFIRLFTREILSL